MIKNQEVLPAIDNEEKKEEVINAKVDQVEVEEKSDTWLKKQMTMAGEREERIKEIKNRISKIEEETIAVKELVPELSKEVVDAKPSNKPPFKKIGDYFSNINQQRHNPYSYWSLLSENDKESLYDSIVNIHRRQQMLKMLAGRHFESPTDIVLDNISIDSIIKNKIKISEDIFKIGIKEVDTHDPFLVLNGSIDIDSPLLTMGKEKFQWRAEMFLSDDYTVRLRLAERSVLKERLMRSDDYEEKIKNNPQEVENKLSQYINEHSNFQPALNIDYDINFDKKEDYLTSKILFHNISNTLSRGGASSPISGNIANNYKKYGLSGLDINYDLAEKLQELLKEYVSQYVKPNKFSNWSAAEINFRINSEISTKSEQDIDKMFQDGLRTGEFDSLLLYIGDGAQKFLDITASEQYRVAGKEFQLLQEYKKDLVTNLVNSNVYDLGPGDGHKAKELLRGVQEKNNQKDINYHPVDINPTMVYATADNFRDFPEVNISGLVCDFHKLKDKVCTDDNSFLLLGNTIGNGDENYQIKLLQSIRQAMKDGERLVIGAQLKTDLKQITEQYNSPELSALCKNVISRFGVAESELDYYAQADEVNGCVEMKLIFKKDRAIDYRGVKKDFKKGDELKIVVSQKYELMQLDGLLAASGLAVNRVIVNQSQDYELVVAQAITKKIAA